MNKDKVILESSQPSRRIRMRRVYRRLQDELLMQAGNGLFIGLQSACSCQHSQWQQHEGEPSVLLLTAGMLTA